MGPEWEWLNEKEAKISNSAKEATIKAIQKPEAGGQAKDSSCASG